jgi:hypothetical protein
MTQILDIKTVVKAGQIDMNRLNEEVNRMSDGSKFSAVLMYLNSRWLSEGLFSMIRKKNLGPLIGMNLDDKA